MKTHLVKRFLYNALENNEQTIGEMILGLFFSGIIIINVVFTIIATIPSLHVYSNAFLIFEYCSLIIFTLEYLARLWVQDQSPYFSGRLKSIASPLMIFDALVIIPGVVSLFFPGIFDTRILRIVRVFRILRLHQYSQSLTDILRIIKKHKSDLLSAFSLIFMGAILASTLMYYAEKDLQPEKFASIPHAMYWGFITLSTIGYGDVAPISNWGKIIAVCTALMGVAIYALPTSILGAAFYAEMRSRDAQKILMLEKQLTQMKKYIEESTEDADRLSLTQKVLSLHRHSEKSQTLPKIEPDGLSEKTL